MPIGKTYWIEKNMLGETLENIDFDMDGRMDHVRFGIKSSFIHADHPLGWIRNIEASINGEAADPGDIFFVVRENWVPLSSIRTISDIWWKMAEMAYITIRRDCGIEPGSHDIVCTMEFSSLFNTRTVDYHDFSNRMKMTLRKTMTTPGITNK